MDKILARAFSHNYITDIINHRLEWAFSYTTEIVSSILEKSKFAEHDSEGDFDFSDFTEPKAAHLDTNVSFSLNIKR
jgi:hypothetical protein